MRRDQLSLFDAPAQSAVLVLFPLDRMSGAINRIAKRLSACTTKIAADKVWHAEIRRLTDQLRMIGVADETLRDHLRKFSVAVETRMAEIGSDQQYG